MPLGPAWIEPILWRMQGDAIQREPAVVALVTRATGAIGKAIAKLIASRPGFEVVLLCRDPRRADSAVAEIQRRSGNLRVRHEIVDLALSKSIGALAVRWQGPAQVLVNNLAVAPPPGREHEPAQTIVVRNDPNE